MKFKTLKTKMKTIGAVTTLVLLLVAGVSANTVVITDETLSDDSGTVIDFIDDYFYVKNATFTDNVTIDGKTITSDNISLWDSQMVNYSDTVTVAKSGGDYTTIQAALDDNGASTLIMVYPGTYTDDSIHFTANNQCVRGMGLSPKTILVTTADSNIVRCDYTGGIVSMVKIMVTAATTNISTVDINSSCNFYRCHIGMASASGFAGWQPSCIYSPGTVKMSQGTLEYGHTGVQAVIKHSVSLGPGCHIDLNRVNIIIENSGASTASNIAYGASTGNINVTRCDGTVHDNGCTFLVGFYAAGTGYHEFNYNTLHVEGTANTAYGVYVTGTPVIRAMFNHIHVSNSGGNAYSYSIGAGATVISQFEDIVAANGYVNFGTFTYLNSMCDGSFNVSNNLTVTENVTAHNVWIPAYIRLGSKSTIAVATTMVWENITFNESCAGLCQGFAHTFDDATNDTIKVNNSGIYKISYFMGLEDSAVTPDAHVGFRIINATDQTIIKGSYGEFDTSKKDIYVFKEHSFITSFENGDDNKVQFTSDDTTVTLKPHVTFNPAGPSCQISIHKIANN